MAFEDLVAVLRRERDLLDQLRFRFIETRLLLAAGEVRYLRWATAEAEHARRRASEVDLLRAAAVHRVGIKGARGGAPTLREVARAAGEPLGGILRDHHEGLCSMVSEIEVIGHRNAELARAGIGQVAASSAAAGGGGDDVAAGGTATLRRVPPMTDDAELRALADEAAFQEVITLAGRLRMPALLAFLR